MAFNVNELTSENTPMRWRIQSERMKGTDAKSTAAGAVELAGLDSTYQAVLNKAGTFTSAEELGEGNQPGGGDIAEPSPVLVSSVDIIGGDLEVEVGATMTLTATVRPDNATLKTVTWDSSDDLIATVVAGLVTGVAKGDVVITATADDANGAQDTYIITVV